MAMSGIYGAWTVTLPIDLLTWLATTDVRMALAGSRVVYGLLRFAHLTCLAGFLGLLLAFELRALGVLGVSALAEARTVLGRALGIGFWGTILSGIALFLYDPLGTGLHSMFLPKLVLVALGYTLTRVRRWLPARPVAIASLLIWVLVIGAATWNKVERPVQINAALKAASVGRN